ncbi:hypothetical protein Tco_0941754 [Tanacetum coccineum]|uniref:Uncharacterized protein n=1 Tax=Tanacetum coccineum TaxID=301880 RepID=A0ABQ5DYH7_9ASTR
MFSGSSSRSPSESKEKIWHNLRRFSASEERNKIRMMELLKAKEDKSTRVAKKQTVNLTICFCPLMESAHGCTYAYFSQKKKEKTDKSGCMDFCEASKRRRLTMEEIVNKFIEERKQEHEEMDALIKEFRTTNELLLKERNNSLSELEFEVYGLSRAINKAQMVGYEAKGVTTRGGKSITEPIGDNTNTNKHPLPHHDEPTTPDEISTKTEP